MILIVGGDSVMGGAVKRQCSKAGLPFVATSRRPGSRQFLDLADAPEKWTLPKHVDSAILCASVTGQKYCEKHPAETRLINVERTIALAARLVQQGAFVVFLSSSLVFPPGKAPAAENEAPGPTTEYGRQKAGVEAALLPLSPNAAIARLGKVIFPELQIFQKWADELRAHKTIYPYSDLYFSPIDPDTAAAHLLTIATRRLPGIHHIAAKGELSYAEAAHIICTVLGADKTLCVPVISPPSVPKGRSMATGHQESRSLPEPADLINAVAAKIP